MVAIILVDLMAQKVGFINLTKATVCHQLLLTTTLPHQQPADLAHLRCMVVIVRWQDCPTMVVPHLLRHLKHPKVLEVAERSVELMMHLVEAHPTKVKLNSTTMVNKGPSQALVMI